MERTTDSFPAVTHCHADGRIVTVAFRGGSAISGKRTICAGCGTAFVYVKPTAAALLHARMMAARHRR